MIKNLSRNRFFQVAAFVFACLPVIFLFYLIAIFGVNFPQGFDDILVLDVVMDFEKSDSLIEKLKILFSPHNEHNIAYVHFVTWLIYKFNGLVNFRTMMFIGNLGLVFGALHHIYVIQKREKSLWWALPIPFLIFQLQLELNTFWGMGSLQNHSVLAWVSLTIYFASVALTTSEFLLFIAFGLLATFTSAGGMPALMMGIAILFYRKQFKRGLLGILVLIPCILIYQYNYNKYFANQGFTENTLLHPLGQFLSIFVVLGDMVDYRQSAGVRDIFFGIIVFKLAIYAIILTILPHSFYQNLSSKNRLLRLLLLPYPTIQQHRNTNLFYVGCLVFVMMIALLVAVRRFYLYNSVDEFLGIPLIATRYGFHSMMAVVSIYGIFVNCFKGNKKVAFMLIFLGFGIATNVFSYWFLPKNIYMRHQTLKADYVNMTQNDFGIIYNGKNILLDSANEILKDAEKGDFYQVPEEIKSMTKPVEQSNQIIKVEDIYESSIEVFIFIKATENSFWNPEKTSFLEVYSSNQKILFPISPTYNTRKNMLLGNVYQKGFTVIIPKNLLKNKEIYSINLLNYTPKRPLRCATNATFGITNNQLFSFR
jgi:hypothetical protein